MGNKPMIIVKHLENPGHYLFLVPKYEEWRLGACMLVKCQTRKGEQLGITLCAPFDADPEVICPLFGTTPEKMKYVTAVFDEKRLSVPEELKGDITCEIASFGDSGKTSSILAEKISTSVS